MLAAVSRFIRGARRARSPLSAFAACLAAASAADAAPAPPAPVSARSALPPLPSHGVPKPSGPAGHLTVLDWAGFKSAVSWTFDDAQPSHVAHYPELQAVGVPMTFYVTTANAEKPGFDKVWAQAVKDGHELGNHSVHHCHANLTGCTSGRPFPTLDEELDQATRSIIALSGQRDVWTMAAPFGDVGYIAVAKSRFFINRGVPGGTIGAGDHTDPFNLPVHMAVPGETAVMFNRHTDAARADGRWIIFLVHTLTPTDAVWYSPVAVGEVTAAMAHGRSLADVWSGTVVDVAAYWLGARLLRATPPTVAAGGVQIWRWTLPPHFPPGKVVRARVDGGTLSQGGRPLSWNDGGFYEVALDAGALTLTR